jgi:serine/threonine protein kinase
MPLTVGTRLGPYEILTPLGAGGMGEVYKARDTRLDRTVAIKVLPTEVASDPDLRAWFEPEARAIAALDHPHICAIYDVGQADRVDFLVMQFLEGETLAARLARSKGPLPLDEALKVGVEIADALDKAHRAVITHRDVKPANIMLTKTGAKLLDFGLAKLRGPAAPISMSGMTRLPASVVENHSRFCSRSPMKRKPNSRPTGGGWRTPPTRRKRRKSICSRSPLRARNGRCRPMADRIRSGGATAANCSMWRAMGS